MPPVTISEDDILYAESRLLPNGRSFDDERRNFVRNLESIDLKAVPGSGKTTALLAKLIILEKHLPLETGRGILVLSHTNAAVNEIKDRIGKFCPKLFSFPNYVGTIQGFTDDFLAKPYYLNKERKNIYRIDNEIYFERLNAKLKSRLRDQAQEIFMNVSHIKRANYQLLRDYRFGTDGDNNSCLISEMNGERLTISKPMGNTRPENYEDYSEEMKAAIIRYLTQLKVEILKEGVLCFDDAYFLANRYIITFPKIVSLLQRRFQLVFVDEMQDMDRHQHDLLENLFYEDGRSHSIYQRIGDRNQSIYNGNPKVENAWRNRGNSLELSGSLRLSPPIAEAVKYFALEPTDFRGLGVNDDGSQINIRPHLLVFKDESRIRTISTFADLIRGFIESGEISAKPENIYTAIAWNSIWETEQERQDTSKIRLVDYFPDYSKEKAVSKIDHECLESYLIYYDKGDNTLNSIRKNILRSFVKILRLEKLWDYHNGARPFTNSGLLSHLQRINPDMYNLFLRNLFTWSFTIANGQYIDVLREIRAYIPGFLQNFNREVAAARITVNLSEEFINTPCPDVPPVAEGAAANPDRVNIAMCNEIEVTIGTVHSVKGQTHTATLYLESYFQKDGRGAQAKSYESQRLANQFLRNTLVGNEGTRTKQSAKMAYVGLSRPTHLLCFAIHKDRYRNFNGNFPDTWEIVEVV